MIPEVAELVGKIGNAGRKVPYQTESSAGMDAHNDLQLIVEGTLDYLRIREAERSGHTDSRLTKRASSEGPGPIHRTPALHRSISRPTKLQLRRTSTSCRHIAACVGPDLFVGDCVLALPSKPSETDAVACARA